MYFIQKQTVLKKKILKNFLSQKKILVEKFFFKIFAWLCVLSKNKHFLGKKFFLKNFFLKFLNFLAKIVIIFLRCKRKSCLYWSSRHFGTKTSPLACSEAEIQKYTRSQCRACPGMPAAPRGYRYKLCMKSILVLLGILDHLQHSKTLGNEMHTQPGSATRVTKKVP